MRDSRFDDLPLDYFDDLSYDYKFVLFGLPPRSHNSRFDHLPLDYFDDLSYEPSEPNSSHGSYTSAEDLPSEEMDHDTSPAAALSPEALRQQEIARPCSRQR